MWLLKDLRALRGFSANQVAATRSVRLVKLILIRAEEPIYGLFAQQMTPVLQAVATMEYVHPNNLALSTNLEAIAQVIRTAPQDAASMANVSLAVSATIQRVLLARSATWAPIANQIAASILRAQKQNFAPVRVILARRA